MFDTTIDVRVTAIRQEADGVLSVELKPGSPGLPLPAFTPGAHIDVCLPTGSRCYSLTNPANEQDRYVIAVGLAADSAGGSRYVHSTLVPGQELRISQPRNLFALNEEARRYVLIAGGIGITPIRCMFEHLTRTGRPVHLLYAARGRRQAAFADELKGIAGVDLHFDDDAGSLVDLHAYMARFGDDAEFYCCGPAPMLAAYEKAGAALGIDPARLRLERFAAAPAAVDGEKTIEPFTVRFAQSDRTLTIPAGASILDVAIAAGIRVDYSCRSGNCGACETDVLEGTPDHRDSVLSRSERESGRTMMICVSGCTGSHLVLDR